MVVVDDVLVSGPEEDRVLGYCNWQEILYILEQVMGIERKKRYVSENSTTENPAWLA